MEDIKNKIKELEISMWKTVVNNDINQFFKLVSKDAIMVCGGYRCSGEEYSQFIPHFKSIKYDILNYETILITNDIVQNHYVITTSTDNQESVDLCGTFHITSTWKKINSNWILMFNMDSRITENQN